MQNNIVFFLYLLFPAATICPVRLSLCQSRPATPSEPRRTEASWSAGASKWQIWSHVSCVICSVSAVKLICPVTAPCPAGSWRSLAAAAPQALTPSRLTTRTTGRTKAVAGTAATPSASPLSAQAVQTWRMWTPASCLTLLRAMRERWERERWDRDSTAWLLLEITRQDNYWTTPW